MKKIKLDAGLEEVLIGGGVLRFNPRDPNLFARFESAAEKLQTVEKEMVEKAKTSEQDGLAVMQILQDADKTMKEILSWVFGGGNDFDAILQGVNLLAVASNGQRVVTNLFAALEPMLMAGAKDCAQHRAEQAVMAAKARRGQ